jgi:DNA modification methylase
MKLNTIHIGDCLEVLKTIPGKSIDCCVTSPPYFGLRDYGHEEQIGNEGIPEEFVLRLVTIFNEVSRVLKDEGTLWLNLGDSYASGPKNRTPEQATRLSNLNGGLKTQLQSLVKKNSVTGNLKPKDLIGVPWMVAFALRSSGWYLRQDIVWHKPNPMPESVTDRCTKSHEYIFLMSKSIKYYYDHEAIKTESKDPLDDIRRIEAQTWDNKNTPDRLRNGFRPKKISHFGNRNGELNGLHSGNHYFGLEKANKRSVWTVNTKPYSDAHFATFPEDLIVDCIKAGCPEGGIVLDPFMGAGTTALVARKLNRNFIGIELNPVYVKLANRRLIKELGMFQ